MNKENKVVKGKNVFSTILFMVFLGVLFFISGIEGVIKILFSLLLYTFIAYIFYIFWKYLRKKEKLNVGDFFQYFLSKVITSITMLITVLALGSYYFNTISPTSMPTYYLSNGEKKLVFQAMSHIGTQSFYNTIKDDLIDKKRQGYVYYFEGVKPGTVENSQKFNEAIGVKFDKDLYENFSKLYGVVHQDNSIYFNLVNNNDYNVDLSIDEIMKYYSDEKANIEASKEDKVLGIFKNSDEPLDINAEIIKTLSSLNTRELYILQYINKAILNAMIGSEKFQQIIMDNFSNKKLFSIILDKRNELLADKIINSGDNKIFVTYGLLHFKGVLEILKKNNPNWEIKTMKYLYPIQ